MALNLTQAQREGLIEDMNRAAPYSDDDDHICTLDIDLTEESWARYLATMAKRLLEQDDREKAGRS